MSKLKDYLKDGKGNPSSTRLFSYMFLWFFFITNTLALLLIFLGTGGLDVNTILFLLIYDFLLLLAIFAPKQLAKMEEVKEIIGLATGGIPGVSSSTGKSGKMVSKILGKISGPLDVDGEIDEEELG